MLSWSVKERGDHGGEPWAEQKVNRLPPAYGTPSGIGSSVSFQDCRVFRMFEVNLAIINILFLIQ